MKRKRDDSDAATSSSTGGVSESLGDEFDVFLNFRGPDTRLNFTDHLYHSLDGAGIRVFLDDAEIRKGEKIGGELLRAINNSRIYVPIFSRDYASSAWCLRELVHMVECLRRSTDKAILPIFFNVDPYDVKLGTGLYSDALKKHEDRFSYDELRRWKEALTEVASIKGWHCKDIGQGELIKLVTNEVSRKLSRGVGVVPDHLIGIDDHVQAVMDLLGKDSLDVRFVVIHGMSGIGKTTLAKVVFNQIASQFQGCSFLSNVCEFSQLGKIVKLQNRLLSEILKSQSIKVQDTDSGINMIRGRCRHKKVLIVLDNLDKRDQLAKLAEKCDWFGSGSRIIVTTRDISFLKIYKNNVSMHPKAYQFYEMGEMHDSLAIRLFSRYAFESDTPPLEYDKITREIVKITGGLPLALVVIGSSLCNESEEGWDDVLAKLKKMPHKEVQDILKGTEKNNGTQTRGQSQVCNITCEDISELVKLRLLEFDGGNFVGDFQDLLLELRWLYKQQ